MGTEPQKEAVAASAPVAAKSSSSTKTIVIILVVILALCCVASLAGLFLLGYAGNKAADSVSDAAVKLEMITVQTALTSYYAENGEYPQSLSTVWPTKELAGESLTYIKISDDEYELSVQLPSGEEYVLTNENYPLEDY